MGHRAEGGSRLKECLLCLRKTDLYANIVVVSNMEMVQEENKSENIKRRVLGWRSVPRNEGEI